ncbi:MAG: tetratricopeptide repeat protein [Terriglobales bacterium]|jgi:eukaryotic-like serine/threonine-protein kinase
MTNKKRSLYEFGPFRLDPDRRMLLRENKPVPVQPKAFDILLVLVENSEMVVLKDDLLKKVWPDTFVEESNLAQNIFVLRKILGDSAGKNRYIVTVPGRGYRFAEEVTEITSSSSADENLVVESQSIERVTITQISRPSRRFLWAGTALLLVAGSVVGYRAYRSYRARHAVVASATPTIPARRSVAVLGFRDLSGRPEDAWLSTALAEMMNTELAAGEKLRLVPGEDVARTKLDLLVPDADSLSKDTLARLHKRLGTDVVVLGSYASLGGKSKGSIRLDLRVQDAVAGETMAEVATTGREDDLFDLVSRAGTQLREKLGLGAVSTEDAIRVKASLPANPEAARLYAEGLARLRVFDAQAACDLLQRSLSADPKYPLSHAALSEAWSALGYDKKASDQAKLAFQLSANLSREDRLLVEGSYRLAHHEFAKAIDVYRTLSTLFPDNLDYVLRLAHAQYDGSKPNDALATIANMRKLPSSGSGDARIDLQEAQAWDDLSDYKHEQEPLQRALQKAQAQGARLLVARVLLQQCRDLRFLGQPENTAAACREARDTYATAGDRAGEAEALRSWANAITESDQPGAIALDRQALDMFRSIGYEGGMANAMNTLGLLYHEQGELAAADKIYRESLAIFRQLDNTASSGKVTANLANVLLEEGDLDGALRLYKEAAELDRAVGDAGSAAIVGYNLANVEELRGDLPAAKQGFEDSLSQFTKLGDQYDSGFALYSLGEILLTEADFARARKMLEDSLAIRKQAGDKVTLAETRMLLADLTLEEGRAPSESEAVARQVVEDFQKEKSQDDEAQAWSLLARTLVAERKFDEAKHAAEQAVALSEKGKNLELRMVNAIIAARVKGLDDAPVASPDRTALIKQLASIASEAKKHGYLEEELEARLATGEIEMKTGSTTLAQSHLAALEADARAKSFNLIAQKAAVARAHD